MLEMKKLAIFPQSYVIKLNRFKCELLKYTKSYQIKTQQNKTDRTQNVCIHCQLFLFCKGRHKNLFQHSMSLSWWNVS